MKKQWASIAAVLLVTSLLHSAHAQQDVAIEPERLEAAHGLLIAMEGKRTYEESIERTLEAQVRLNPALAEFGGVMRKFFAKYMSWDSVEDFMAASYAREFTAGELHELAAFYRTPLGRKIALVTPRIGAAASELGMKRTQEHMSELQEMIQEEMENKQGDTLSE